MKLHFFIIPVALIPALTFAAEDVPVPVVPIDPDPEEHPLPKKKPARAPQVTVTDGTLLTVDRIAADASLAIEILRDGECIFSTFTLEHSVAIPMLDGPHTYTINLTVNGTLWTGTYMP